MSAEKDFKENEAVNNEENIAENEPATEETAKGADCCDKANKSEKSEKCCKGGKKKERELEAELLKYKEAAEKAEAALKESEDKYLRILAEYDNYRKRTAKEKEGI